MAHDDNTAARVTRLRRTAAVLGDGLTGTAYSLAADLVEGDAAGHVSLSNWPMAARLVLLLEGPADLSSEGVPANA